MAQSSTPGRQYLAPYDVLPAMKREAEYFLTRTAGQTLVLALTGGMFVTMGALFSLLLSDGVSAQGPKLLLQGLGFSTGFFMIILSRAALFTEVNVLIPANTCRAFERSSFYRRCAFGVSRGLGICWVRLYLARSSRLRNPTLTL